MNEKILNIIFILLFFIFSLAILLMMSPGEFFYRLKADIASSIGISVSVPTNRFNELARQLEEKESFLSEKEKTLIQKESDLLENNIFNKKNNRLIILMGFIFFVLITAAFYVGYKRKKCPPCQ